MLHDAALKDADPTDAAAADDIQAPADAAAAMDERAATAMDAGRPWASSAARAAGLRAVDPSGARPVRRAAARQDDSSFRWARPAALSVAVDARERDGAAARAAPVRCVDLRRADEGSVARIGPAAAPRDADQGRPRPALPELQVRESAAVPARRPAAAVQQVRVRARRQPAPPPRARARAVRARARVRPQQAQEPVPTLAPERRQAPRTAGEPEASAFSPDAARASPERPASAARARGPRAFAPCRVTRTACRRTTRSTVP